jgi:hypothetical protein
MYEMSKHTFKTNDMNRTAYHEAGHALASIPWGGGVEFVSIVPDETTTGRCVLDGLLPIDMLAEECAQGGDARREAKRRLLWHVRIHLAGYAAEETLTGERPEPMAEFLACGYSDHEFGAGVDERGDLTKAAIALRTAYPHTGRFCESLTEQYVITLEYLATYRWNLDRLAATLLREGALEGDALFEATDPLAFDETWRAGWVMRGTPRAKRRQADLRSAIAEMCEE